MRISSTRVRFWAENSNLMLGLLVGVLRCYRRCLSVHCPISRILVWLAAPGIAEGSGNGVSRTTFRASLQRCGAAEKDLKEVKGVWRSTRLARETGKSFDAMAEVRIEVNWGMLVMEENDGSSWQDVLRAVSQSASTDYSLHNTATKHSQLSSTSPIFIN